MAANDETKIFPGNIENYRELRKLRESYEVPGSEGQVALKSDDPQVYLASVIAEQLSGLAYILDGIRYSARTR